MKLEKFLDSIILKMQLSKTMRNIKVMVRGKLIVLNAYIAKEMLAIN